MFSSGAGMLKRQPFDARSFAGTAEAGVFTGASASGSRLGRCGVHKVHQGPCRLLPTPVAVRLPVDKSRR